MIIDTSVLAAVMLREPDAGALLKLMASAPVRRISAASYVELAAVIDGRRDPQLSGAVDILLRIEQVELAQFTPAQARLARSAYQQFGRGSGHPARLNMGDCFSYALARDLGEPLLFKGRDFALTDIELHTDPIRGRRLSEVLAGYATSS